MFFCGKIGFGEIKMTYDKNFFDLNSQHSAENGLLLKSEFISRCSLFLETQHICKSTAEAIAESLFARMSDRKLHYHTPVHVLAMLDFAKNNEITLEPWEELAVWFHDSIYDVNQPFAQNEELSAKFMKIMVSPYFSNAVLPIETSFNAIIATANHLHVDQVNQLYHKVLDLDLSSFSSPRENYNRTTEALFLEYPIERKAFDKGRKKFLTELNNRPKIYLTSLFEQFESKARQNIALDLEELGDV